MVGKKNYQYTSPQHNNDNIDAIDAIYNAVANNQILIDKQKQKREI